VSVAIRKVEGVESVKVSLNEGYADIKLKPGSKVSVEQIRAVVRDNGFTPKGADVQVMGELTERGGKPALAVSGLDLVYLLDALPESTERFSDLVNTARGKKVMVSGHLQETVKGDERPHTLLVRDFSLAER